VLDAVSAPVPQFFSWSHSCRVPNLYCRNYPSHWSCVFGYIFFVHNFNFSECFLKTSTYFFSEIFYCILYTLVGTLTSCLMCQIVIHCYLHCHSVKHYPMKVDW
jgi:hypothetical protein